MAVFLQVITLFLLIFCGFFSAKGKLVDENGISTLNKIVLYFALPALTLYGLQKDASPELIHDLILVFFISLAIMILSGLIAYFLYRSEPNERRSVLTNLAMLSNSAYMGYPVVIATLRILGHNTPETIYSFWTVYIPATVATVVLSALVNEIMKRTIMKKK